MTALALFGVVHARHPVEGLRAAGVPVVVVTRDDLAVLGLPVEDGHRFDDEDALLHFEVLSRLVRDGAVLPFPPGTVAPGPEAVHREVLSARAGEFAHRIAVLDARAEFRVALTFDVEAGLRAAAVTDPALTTLAAGAAEAGASLDELIRLGDDVLTALTRWWSARAEELLAPVVAVSERRTGVPVPRENIVRTALLVHRDRWPRLEASLGRVRDTARGEAEVSVVGPLPAYSFLDVLDDPDDGRPGDGRTGDRTPGAPPGYRSASSAWSAFPARTW